jgi:hypothetical protein
MDHGFYINWTSWALILVVWLTCWIILGAKGVATKAGDERLALVQILIRAFIISTWLGMFALGLRAHSVVSVIALLCHHAAFLALFCFLIVGQFFQAEAWWSIRKRRFTGAAASYRRLWVLTELFPAPIALTILLTGLRLIWEGAIARPPVPAKSPATFWLLVIIIGFGVFFWDGILGYTPIVRKWKNYWEDLDINNLPLDGAPCHPKLTDSLQLWVHCLSWPAVFLCGVYRWEIPNPATDFVGHAIQKLEFLPTGWPEVIIAAAMWLLTGGIVAAIRFCIQDIQDYCTTEPSHASERRCSGATRR